MSRTIEVECPGCGAKYSLGKEYWDRNAVCPACETTFYVVPPSVVPGGLGDPPPQHSLDSEAAVPVEWKVGDVILDLYEVKEIHEGGGMGLVYRVYHRGWNMDLAVKSPRSKFFQTEAQKADFTRECETWINLGLHPHIVSCHYVRTLGGIPRVFAEYVEGGSLKDWIDSRKLYDGGPQEALKRILDIAIQMAWGLDYAHEQGLVHQDVKPANVLMTPDGTAKISDFGLAKARVPTAETTSADPTKSVLVSSGWMTPQYCSPEQVAGRPLSRKTDIWSWAVSVLEMFVGEVCWQSGLAAPEILESLVGDEKPKRFIPGIPTALRELLQRCFRKNAEDRPSHLADVADTIKAIYQKLCRQIYARKLPEKVELGADSFNNRALSAIDLKMPGDKRDKAYPLFLETLQTNPTHLLLKLNLAMYRWRFYELPAYETRADIQNALAGRFARAFTSWAASLSAEQYEPYEALSILEQRGLDFDSVMATKLRDFVVYLKLSLSQFFNGDWDFNQNCFSQWQREDPRIDELQQKEFLPHVTFSPARKVVGLLDPESQNERQLLLKDWNSGTALLRISCEEGVVRTFAISESGTALVVVTRKRLLSESESLQGRPKAGVFWIQVWDIVTLSRKASFDAGTDFEFSSVELRTAVDDCGSSILIWAREASVFGSGSFWLEFEYCLDQDTGEYIKFEPRTIPQILRFDVAKLSGDGSQLLLATKAGQVQLWNVRGAHRSFNVLSVHLEQFGLLRSTEYLPGFQFSPAFDYQINDFNAYQLLNLFRHFNNPFKATFLYARPPDTKAQCEKEVECKNWEQESDAAAVRGDIRVAVELLDRCMCQDLAMWNQFLEKRQSLALGAVKRRVFGVEHVAQTVEYWDRQVVGIQSWTPGDIYVLRRNKMDCGIVNFHNHFLRDCSYEDYDSQKADCRPLLLTPQGIGLFEVASYRGPETSFSIVGAPVMSGGPQCMERIQKLKASGWEWGQKVWVLDLPRRLPRDCIAYLSDSVWALFAEDKFSRLDQETGKVLARFDLPEPIERVQTFQTPDGNEMFFLASKRGRICYFFDPLTCEITAISAGFSAGWDIQYLAESDALLGISGFCVVHRAHDQSELVQIPRAWRWLDTTRARTTNCGRAVAFATEDRLRVWDVATARFVFEWQVQPTDFVFDKSGRWLLVAHSLNYFERFELFWEPF